MRTLNAFLSHLGDVLLSPFASHPLVGLLFWGAVCGVVMTWIFGKTSNQCRLKELADQTKSHLLAIRLFKHDLVVTFRCQGQLLRTTGLRLWHSTPPTLVMLVPICLVFIQLAQWYEFVPLEPGQASVVDLELSSDTQSQPSEVLLDPPAGVDVETDSHWDPSRQQLSWRVRPEIDRPTMLRWKVGAEVVEQELAVAKANGPLMGIAARRPSSAWWDQMLHPRERPCPSGELVRAINVQYARRQTPILGLDIPWWATFGLVAMAVALICRRSLGVDF